MATLWEIIDAYKQLHVSFDAKNLSMIRRTVFSDDVSQWKDLATEQRFIQEDPETVVGEEVAMLCNPDRSFLDGDLGFNYPPLHLSSVGAVVQRYRENHGEFMRRHCWLVERLVDTGVKGFDAREIITGRTVYLEPRE